MPPGSPQMTRAAPVRVVLLAVAVAVLCAMGTACSGADGADAPAPGTSTALMASGPVVALQDDFLPIVPLEQIPERLDLIAGTGATTSRVDLFWWEMARERPDDPSDPDDPAYDFARADAILTGMAQRGITPIVAVYSAPPWAAGGAGPEDPVNPVNPNPPDPEAFGEFMGAIATRYAGDFAGPDGPLPAQRHWEIWNEPNFSRFLLRPVPDDPESVIDRYAEMVEAAHPAIKDANPDSVVIAGAGGPRGSTGGGAVGAVSWMEGLVAREIPLDAYSQHVYPASAPLEDTPAVPSWSTLDVFLDGIEGFAPDLPLFVTEAGYTTEVTRYRDASVTVTPEEQAEYLGQIYALPQVADPRIRAIVWFNFQDNVDWPAGLLYDDGTRKPSYDAFRQAVTDSGGATLVG